MAECRFFALHCIMSCEQLKAITDRMVKSLDFDISGFFSEIDRSLEASRSVFRRLESVMTSLTEADWLRIEAKVVYCLIGSKNICSLHCLNIVA